MSGILSGISAFGHNVGVGSSYGAFMAPLGHIAARLHAIGAQARESVSGDPYKPMVLVCAHAGLKTGEDGPTHADPQALQLAAGKLPAGHVDHAHAVGPAGDLDADGDGAGAAARRHLRPSSPGPTSRCSTARRSAWRRRRRPPPASTCCGGPRASPTSRSCCRRAPSPTRSCRRRCRCSSRRASTRWSTTSPARSCSTCLPADERRRLFPEERAREAMAITGFTLPTMYRWVHSEAGLAASLHPYRNGHYLGSGPGPGGPRARRASTAPDRRGRSRSTCQRQPAAAREMSYSGRDQPAAAALAKGYGRAVWPTGRRAAR